MKSLKKKEEIVEILNKENPSVSDIVSNSEKISKILHVPQTEVNDKVGDTSILTSVREFHARMESVSALSIHQIASCNPGYALNAARQMAYWASVFITAFSSQGRGDGISMDGGTGGRVGEGAASISGGNVGAVGGHAGGTVVGEVGMVDEGFSVSLVEGTSGILSGGTSCSVGQGTSDNLSDVLGSTGEGFIGTAARGVGGTITVGSGGSVGLGAVGTVGGGIVGAVGGVSGGAVGATSGGGSGSLETEMDEETMILYRQYGNKSGTLLEWLQNLIIPRDMRKLSDKKYMGKWNQLLPSTEGLDSSNKKF